MMRTTLAAALATTLVACGGGADAIKPPAIDSTSVVTVSLSPSSASVEVGKTKQFTATARNAFGQVLTSPAASWQSSSTSMASVNSSGLATGIAAGTSTITATAGSVPATALLTVTAPVITWVTKADMLIARYGMGSAVVSGIIYTFGGGNFDLNALNPSRSTVEAYDPATNTWTTKAFMTTARATGAAAAVNGIVYVFGGDNAVQTSTSSNIFKPLTTVEAYDPVANTWSTKASMPVARERFAIAEVSGVIYVMGGIVPSGTFVDVTTSVVAYNPATNTWSTKAPMPTARGDFSASVVNGVIYAMGGQSLKTLEAYDPATNTWTTKASMTFGGSTASVAANGLVYAQGPDSWIEVYNPTTNSWAGKDARSDYTYRERSSLALIGNVMYSMGGHYFLSGTMKVVEARPLP